MEPNGDGNWDMGKWGDGNYDVVTLPPAICQFPLPTSQWIFKQGNVVLRIRRRCLATAAQV